MSNTQTKKRFIVAARSAQTDNVAIREQLAAGYAKAAALGGTVVGECIENGVSGITMSRSRLFEAVEQIERGEADGIICANLARLSRDVSIYLLVKDRIYHAGGEIVLCWGTLA